MTRPPDVRTEHAARLDDVRAAARRIAAFVHRTPVITSRQLDERAGCRLFFKCENLQRVGAFKMRGAANAILCLPDDVARRGVVTHSSGNFAQALALAARLRGIEAHIIMPRTAPAVKRRATEGYGAHVYECEQSEREATAAAVAQRTGGTIVHPYDHGDIIAGQGTATLELLEDAADLDAVIAPVGGGGLTSGMCITAHGLRSCIRCFAAEPAGADDAARSLAAGRRQPPVMPPNTVADGLLTGLGELTWPILRDHLEAVITVDDQATMAAMRFVMERMKLVIEPSAAVAVAAVCSDEFRSLEGIERVGVILSGGNVELERVLGGA